MICLTGDIHHASLGTGNQQHSDRSEVVLEGDRLTGLREDNRDRAASIEQLLLEKFPDKQSFRLSRSFSSCIRHDFHGPSVHMTNIDMTDVEPKLFAFSGIAHPQRFYRMLESYGCDVKATRNFGDHHAYVGVAISIQLPPGNGGHGQGAHSQDQNQQCQDRYSLHVLLLLG